MGRPLNWLLMIYKVPTEPARKRTYVWRKLKKLGAIYLQQAVALMPDRPNMADEMEGLAQKIVEFGGEVTLLKTRSASNAWEQDVLGRFNRQRDEEYAEVAEGAQRIIDELDREGRRGKFSFAELEENEEALESLRRWLAQVTARDFFGAASRPATEGLIEQAATHLQAFAERVEDQAQKKGEN